MAEIDLDALLDEHGTWKAVAETLVADAAAMESDAERAAVYRTVIEVHRDWEENAAGEAEALELLLEVEPDNAEALTQLIAAYERAEDWESVTAVMLDTVPSYESPAERAAVLRRAATIYSDKLAQPEGAQLVLQKALNEDPGSDETLDAVSALWTELGDIEGLAQTFNDHAGMIAESQGEAASLPLIVRAANTYLAAENLTLADALLMRAGLIDESNEDVLRAQALVREQTQDWEALVETLRRHAGITLDAEEELRLRRHLGRALFEQLEDPGGAIAEFSRAFELSHDADDATTLAALYEATGRADEYVSLLRRQLADESEPSVRAAMLVQIGGLHRGPLADPRSAAHAYRDALELDPGASAALSGLADVLESDGDWAGLAEHLQRWKGRSDDDAERGTLLLRRAAILEQQLADPVGALATLEELRALDDTVDGCLAGLLRLYTAVQRHDDAAAVHMRLAELAGDTDAWRGHLLAAAELYHGVGAVEDAAATYQAVLGHDPNDAVALRALEAIQTEVGDVAGAIDSLGKRADVTTDATEKVSLLYKRATLQNQSDAAAAAATLGALLQLDPGHESASALYAEALEKTEQWDALLEHLGYRGEHLPDLAARASAKARAGLIRQTHRDDAAGARELFEAAVLLDPRCVTAARPLVDFYLEDEAWERALPLLQTLAAETGAEASAADRHTLHLNLAATQELLGLSEDAVEHYEAALSFDSSSVVAAQALARLHHGAGRYVDADRLYRSLVLEQFEGVPEPERIDVLFRAGETAAQLNDSERAGRLFGRALEMDEFFEPALKALAALGSDEADGAAALEAKQKLLQLTDDPNERFGLLLEIGDGFQAGGFPDGAAEAYQAALELRPESKAALHKLLTLHSGGERWEEAAEVLVKLAALEDSEPKRDKLLFTVGAIYRDQLEDIDRAHNVFDNLLDRDPMSGDALDALESLHRDRQDWARLEKVYRRQIERVLGDESALDLRFELLRRLAKLYRDRLDRPDDAIAAFQAASLVQPDNVKILEEIAAIYPTAGKTDDDLIAQHRALVRLVPEREDSHHVLFGAFHRERRFDEAWTTAAVLTVLGSREKGPTSFYTEHRPASVPLARRGLSRHEWRVLQHPDLSVEATRLLSVLAGTLRRVYSLDIKDWGVHRRKDWIDVSQPGAVTNLFHYSAQVLGVAMPALYRWNGEGFQNANAEPRAVLLGADVQGGTSDRRMVFRVARMLCLMRNEFYLAAALTPTTLVPLVQASISLFRGGPPPEWNTEPVQAWMAAIGDEPDEILTTLGEAVGVYLQSGQSLNLKAWPKAVELTAGRAALLLCGDLQRAAQACAGVPRVLGDLDVQERVLDLVEFASSDQYAMLRGELGLGIGQQ